MNKYYTVGGYTDIEKLPSDGSDNYATNTGHILEFKDARGVGSAISFKAFINGFSQSFTSNWNTEQVFGRMDDLATFKNTTRSISVSWEVPSESLKQAQVNLQRCNKLVHLLYPTYDPAHANTMKKAPFVTIKYSNLLQSANGTGGLFGYITGLTWTPVLELGYYHSKDGIFPKVISISVEFTAIHYGGKGETGYLESSEGLGIRKDSKFPFGGPSKI